MGSYPAYEVRRLKFSMSPRNNEALKPDPDWLVRMGMLEELVGVVVLAEQALFDFRIDVPLDQIAKWLSQNAVADSFVSRTLAANFASANDSVCATWDATAQMCDNPYIVEPDANECVRVV
jgi:hypothetical protein